MDRLPQHTSSQFFNFGIRLHRIDSSKNSHVPVTYSHQDDYYIFGLMEKGTACCIIDFKEQRFSSGDVFLIQPGQVHRFISSESAEGWLLMVDNSFVESAEKCIFDNFSLFASSLPIDRQRRSELAQIAHILAGRLDSITDMQTKATARRFAETFVGIVAEAVHDINLLQVKYSRRHIELVLSFRRLLDVHLAESRRPSFYASLLNVSTVYLNEVVKGVTGVSATLYIKNEMVLQAKRMLIHTNLTVKEIAVRLGIDDYAYFSRLFAQATGISPILFRKNLE